MFKMFYLIMTAGFILFAIICILAPVDYGVSLVGFGSLLAILILGSAYCRRKERHQHLPRQKRKIAISFILFFIFFVCELVIMGIMLVLGRDASLQTQKVLACLLCLSILFMLLAGYTFEVKRFQDSKQFSEARFLGIAINPKLPIGRIIYISAFLLLLLILFLIIVFGPNDLSY